MTTHEVPRDLGTGNRCPVLRADGRRPRGDSRYGEDRLHGRSDLHGHGRRRLSSRQDGRPRREGQNGHGLGEEAEGRRLSHGLRRLLQSRGDGLQQGGSKPPPLPTGSSLRRPSARRVLSVGPAHVLSPITPPPSLAPRVVQAAAPSLLPAPLHRHPNCDRSKFGKVARLGGLRLPLDPIVSA